MLYRRSRNEALYPCNGPTMIQTRVARRQNTSISPQGRRINSKTVSNRLLQMAPQQNSQISMNLWL
jgi:hypothetical protein